MKKQISLLLLCILFLVAAVSPAGATPPGQKAAPREYATLAEKTLVVYGPDAFLELVNPRYSCDIYLAEGQADLRIWCPDGPALAKEIKDIDYVQTVYTVGMRETAGVGFTLERVFVFPVASDREIYPMEITESILGDGPVHLDPYGSFYYENACPAEGNLRYEIIVAAGTDDNGHSLEFYGVAERLNVTAGLREAKYEDYDTGNLRYQADYEVKVADGVWWVPVRCLGESRYTNREIAEMVWETPEEKQQACSTLLISRLRLPKRRATTICRWPWIGRRLAIPSTCAAAPTTPP